MAEKPSAKEKVTEEVNIHPNWIALIRYCGVAHQNGPLAFSTQAAVPVALLRPGTKEVILFGKESKQPLFVKEIDAQKVRVRITKKWKGLIDFVAESFPYGRVGVEIAAGEPKKPIPKYTDPDIRFDHPESFPPLVRLYKNEPVK